jgi:4-hydroxybenzoate polyprenyltransferase
LTIYARREEQASNQATLVLGTVFELAGLIVVALLPMWTTSHDLAWRLPPNSAYPVLIGLIGITILNRACGGVLHPVPRKVQLAVKHAILSLIMIDAAVVLMYAGTWPGVGVVMLLIPAVIGAMRVRTT